MYSDPFSYVCVYICIYIYIAEEAAEAGGPRLQHQSYIDCYRGRSATATTYDMQESQQASAADVGDRISRHVALVATSASELHK